MQRALACVMVLAFYTGAFAGDEPDPACPTCHGLGIVPNVPYKPYVRFDNQPAEATVPPAWYYCEKCQKGKDAKSISAEMKEIQGRARERHKEALEKTGLKLELVMTPFVALHTNAPAAAAKKIVDTLEKCTGLLQSTLKSMRCVATRPDQDDLYFFSDAKSFETFLDKNEASPEEKKSPFFSQAHLAATKSGPQNDAGIVYLFGYELIKSATSAKASPWLGAGFAAYCENKTLGTNIMAGGTTDALGTKLGNKWADAVGKNVKSLKKWEQLFEVQIPALTKSDTITGFSVVSYLIALDVGRFDKFIQNINDGDDSVTAIEKAYGRKIAELQANWIQWTQTQH